MGRAGRPLNTQVPRTACLAATPAPTARIMAPPLRRGKGSAARRTKRAGALVLERGRPVAIPARRRGCCQTDDPGDGTPRIVTRGAIRGKGLGA